MLPASGLISAACSLLPDGACHCLQDPHGSVVSEGSELSAVVTEIADVTAGPEEGSIALAKRVYAHLYEGNLNSRYSRNNASMPGMEDFFYGGCKRPLRLQLAGP